MNNFKDFRPRGFMGKGDRYLPDIIKGLTKLLIEVYNEMEDNSLPFDEESMEIIAPLLVEFAEDMHNDIGIWDSYERYNLEFFGTRLPLTLEEEYEEELEPGIVPERISHLMWVIFQELHNNLMIISPHCDEIWTLAEETSNFLKEQFRGIPKSSGVKMFLSQPNDYGWEVKKKLIWLGTKSYMFRVLYAGYLESLEDDPQKLEFNGLGKFFGEEDKEQTYFYNTEFFLLKAVTSWSGLGAIDILAETLYVTEEQRNEIRGWYKPHEAAFKVLFSDSCFIELLNVINYEKYTVKIEKKDTHHFKKDYLMSGSLIRWENEWYFSGTRQIYGEFPKIKLELLKSDFTHYFPGLVRIYDKEQLHKDREILKKRYENFTSIFKDNLIIFPNGKEFGEHLKEFYIDAQRENIKDSELAEKLKKFDNEEQRQKLCEIKEGVIVFFNPEEGIEVFAQYDDLTKGLAKNGAELTPDEIRVIYQFIYYDRISPAFVYKLIQKYGDESIFESFLTDKRDKMSLEYLLHRYKGQYYRN